MPPYDGMNPLQDVARIATSARVLDAVLKSHGIVISILPYCMLHGCFHTPVGDFTPDVILGCVGDTDEMGHLDAYILIRKLEMGRN